MKCQLIFFKYFILSHYNAHLTILWFVNKQLIECISIINVFDLNDFFSKFNLLLFNLLFQEIVCIENTVELH